MPTFVSLPARTEYLVAEHAARDFLVAESLYPAHLRIARHAHRGATLTAILRGTFDENGASCDATSIVIRPAGAPHADAIGGAGASNLELDLHGDLAPRAFADFREVRNPSASALARRLSSELRAGDDVRSLAVEGLALELIAFVARLAGSPPARPPAWLRRAHELLHDRFREPLTVAELAAAAGVHPVHFARVFRREYGTTPATLIRRLRIEWAAERIATSDDPIAQIAAEAGFYDHAHFTRLFKGVRGVTPTTLRTSRVPLASRPFPR